jgi:hypothetical protein
MYVDKIKIEISSIPELENPKLICGLPGSGYVGKLAVDYLIDKIPSQKFADIYSSSFPPQVSIQEDGTVDLTKNSLFYYKNKPSDLIFLTGDAQPVSAEAEYTLAEEILKLCKKLNIKEIYTLAAYITGKFSDKPKVFGTSTSKEFVNKFSNVGITVMSRGNIIGMNGVLIGIAQKYSITGVCLLGETSGYVVDAKASKAVLEILSNLLNIKLDMSEITKRAQDTEQIIKSIQFQDASQMSSGQPMGFPMKAEKNIDYIS